MTHKNQDHAKAKNIAEKVRAACIEAAREGFQDASMSGLCREGAIESIKSLDLEYTIKNNSEE
ncbi:acetyltransferase [Halalkalibaculum roseum]|uniref:acetyltransferase n=1 Tax=Halalkalibaculum roseum TaxID=2709311 RepID=UPI0020131694|nr:acetyltransferase [Halalkalibaculum roseum]